MTMTNTGPGSTSEVIGAGLTGTARTTGLLYLGLAVTGLSGSSWSAAGSTSPTTPAARCPTWSNTRRWRALASCSSWASC